MEKPLKQRKPRTPKKRSDSYILPEKTLREKSIKVSLTPEEYVAINELAKDWDVLPPAVFRQSFSILMDLSGFYLQAKHIIPLILVKAKELGHDIPEWNDPKLQEALANIEYKAYAINRLKKYWKR
jgi:hypothetical protein